MEIRVHSSKSVKPHYGDGGVIPLSVFDRVNYDEYIFYVHAFHPPAPPTVTLEAGLARALAAYPEWAGRLASDASAIVLCNAGVRFVEATADSELAVALLAAGNKALSLCPSCDGAEELLLVQTTRFRCGSFAVGFTMHHKVADGPAMCNFMVAWGQATRGVAIDPVPVHDRTWLFARRGPPQIRFQHRGVEVKPRDENPGCGIVQHPGDEVVVHMVHFSREWIMELKSRVSEGSYTTLQCLAAHLWRCITNARGLDGRQVTRIRIAVNGRTRMRRPRVPEGYTGSVVLWAWPATTARQLLDWPLQYAVDLISREVSCIDDTYFRSFIDFASSGAVEEEKLVPTADAAQVRQGTNVDLDCLLGIPFHKLDLGCGGPFFYRPCYSPAPVDGAVYVVKSFMGDGSVDAYVPLLSRTVDSFNKFCYSLPPVAGAARL